MTPVELYEARRRLGLTVTQFAHMIGHNQTNVRRMEHAEWTNTRPVSRTTERLVRAYLDGYRPDDWPQEKE